MKFDNFTGTIIIITISIIADGGDSAVLRCAG